MNVLRLAIRKAEDDGNLKISRAAAAREYARYTRAVGAGKGGRLSYTKLDEAWHEMAGHEYADLSFRYCVVARESGKASALLDAEQVLLCDESSCSHDRSFFYPP